MLMFKSESVPPNVYDGVIIIVISGSEAKRREHEASNLAEESSVHTLHQKQTLITTETSFIIQNLVKRLKYFSGTVSSSSNARH